MLINWLFRLLIPHWDTLILNPATGKPSLKNMAATVGFVAGIGGAAFSVWADYHAGRPIEKSAILLLLGSGLGLSVVKALQLQANRRTADEAGNPLAEPSPPAPADDPKLMPQEPADAS